MRSSAQLVFSADSRYSLSPKRWLRLYQAFRIELDIVSKVSIYQNMVSKVSIYRNMVSKVSIYQNAQFSISQYRTCVCPPHPRIRVFFDADTELCFPRTTSTVVIVPTRFFVYQYRTELDSDIGVVSIFITSFGYITYTQKKHDTWNHKLLYFHVV